ncbi:MAG: choice-of-anchor J domain-containing protein [Ferruginibacter sp.]
MKKKLPLLFIALLCIFSLKAQLTESFDATTFPPTGWTIATISAGDGSGSGIPGSNWDRVTAGTFPTATPHTGAGMARYNSYDFDPTSKADLISPVMDFAGVPKRLSFWMYRSATYIDQDSLTVYVNTASTATGGVLLGKIIRVINSAPVVPAVGWYQYTFDIPASFTGASNYIIFRGNGEFGLDMFIDDIVVANQPTCKSPSAISVSNFNYGANTTTATWTVPTGTIVGYQWAVNTTGTTPASGTPVTGATVNVSGITPNVVNYVYIRTDCGGGDFSTWVSKSFAAVPCATLTAPLNGAVSVPQDQVFSWPAVTGATGYQFFLGDIPGSEVNIGSLTGTSTPVPGILPGTTYSWYILPLIGTVSSPAACTSGTFTTAVEPTTTPNNICSGAISITAANTLVNPVQGTTLNATMSDFSDDCYGDIAAPDDDVWFEFTTNASPTGGTLIITPTSGADSITDIVAVVYPGTDCNNLGALATCADAGTFGSEVIQLNKLLPNTHYFMRVYSWDYGNSEKGAFTVEASLGNTLPIRITKFTAQRATAVNVLKWTTEMELNTDHFEVERSSDGRNFIAIGQVAAARNSNTVRNYTFTDIHPLKGNNYYRLRIFDKDNTFKLSDIRRIRNEGIADISVYPNPVRDRFTVSINADKAAIGQLSITDISGKTVYTRSLKLAQGNTILPVDLNHVSTGSYILKIQLNDDLIVQKINKL